MAMLIKKRLNVESLQDTLGDDVGQGDVTEFDETWDSVPFVLTLPGAGTYLINFTISIIHSGAGAFDNKWLEGRLYDNTGENVVPYSHIYLNPLENLGPNGDFWPRTAIISVLYVVTEESNIVLHISSHSMATFTIEGSKSSNGYLRIY